MNNLKYMIFIDFLKYVCNEVMYYNVPGLSSFSYQVNYN